jgi:hypothetical protein
MTDEPEATNEREEHEIETLSETKQDERNPRDFRSLRAAESIKSAAPSTLLQYEK